MVDEVGNQPSAPPVFELRALHAEPFHLTTWSACAIPATLVESVPTYTSVPLAARARTKLVTAPPPGAPPEPIACHPPPSRYATLSAAGIRARLLNPPPAYSTPLVSEVSANTAPAMSPSFKTVERAAPVFRSHASRKSADAMPAPFAKDPPM